MFLSLFFLPFGVQWEQVQQRTSSTTTALLHGLPVHHHHTRCYFFLLAMLLHLLLLLSQVVLCHLNSFWLNASFELHCCNRVVWVILLHGLVTLLTDPSVLVDHPGSFWQIRRVELVSLGTSVNDMSLPEGVIPCCERGALLLYYWVCLLFFLPSLLPLCFRSVSSLSTRGEFRT